MRYMVYGYKGDFHFHCYVRSPESSKKVSTIFVWMAFLKSILGTTYDVKCDLHREPHLRMNDIWYLINTSIPILSYISQKNGLHLNPETFKKKMQISMVLPLEFTGQFRFQAEVFLKDEEKQNCSSNQSMNAKAQHVFKGVDIFFPKFNGASRQQPSHWVFVCWGIFWTTQKANISRRNDLLEKKYTSLAS